VADEEALFVVVGVDEPASDAVGTVAANFTGSGIEDVHAEDLDLNVAVVGRKDLDVRFAEDDEQIALPGILEIVGHVEVGVHARLQDGNASEFGELRGVRVVAEGTGDQDVEVGVSGLAGGGHEVRTADCAEFRPD